MVESILIDNTNFDILVEHVCNQISQAKLIGFDLETHDANRHDGLNQFMKVNDEGQKSASKKLVFDTRRTTITGFSLYPDGSDYAYYVNLAHADEDKRVPWAKARRLLDAKQAEAFWVAHNAPFEITMMKTSLDYELTNIICTLQMAVSAYGPDEYDIGAFRRARLGEIQKLIGPISRAFRSYKPGENMDAEQADLFSKVISKQSDAAHSYNGVVNSVAYGYGLKKAVETWFGVKMRTFEETLGNKVHMGQLTGPEVVAYGADDAYWAVRLYHRLLQYMIETNPAVVNTFITQELPMIHVYSEVWREGMRVNKPSIEERRKLERTNMAVALRKLRSGIRALLPFEDTLNEGLLKHDGKWYTNNGPKYRETLRRWALLNDTANDFDEVSRISGSVSNAWREEQKLPKSTGPNLTYYMTVRTILYDLMGEKLIIEKGKVQSDAEARGKIRDRVEKRNFTGDAARLTVLDALQEMAGIDQRMKLYLTPYLQLTDPETDRMYPVLSSKLASRRMATSFPNPMQLAKRGESTYVRGFYLADEDDHVILSIDWSGIELVLIGDFSNDPEFRKAFGQLPHADLHSGAAADILSVLYPEMNEQVFLGLKKRSIEEIEAQFPKLVLNLKGERMEDPGKLVKYWRTEVGKGANFGYWYSGALSDVGNRMGWDSETMWGAVDRYRSRFAVAEEWRLEQIAKICRDGYVTLPDGHRRYRYEATNAWKVDMMAMFGNYVTCTNMNLSPNEQFWSNPEDPVHKFANEMIRATSTRAKNQAVNSLIQGSCATLAKRSILRIREEIKKNGWRARFMLPIHDELLFSVHKDEVIEFAKVVKRIMCTHPDIVQNMALDASAAIGLTFEPFGKTAKFGQIELDEAPAVDWLPKEVWGKKLDDSHQKLVLDYLFQTERRKAA